MERETLRRSVLQIFFGLYWLGWGVGGEVLWVLSCIGCGKCQIKENIVNDS